MVYSLSPAAEVTPGLRAAAVGQIDGAIAALTPPTDFHNGIHNARKSLKKLRSLLWLVRPGLPEALFDNLESRLRTAGAALAPARDAQALVDTVDGITRKTPGFAKTPAIQNLKRWLREKRDEAERNTQANPITEALQELDVLRGAFSRLSIYPDNFSTIASGLKQSYRETRKAYRAALLTDKDETLHEWRKLVQRHWRQLQLLSPCAAESMGARAEYVHHLAQLLGDDHDLANLRHLLAAPVITFGDATDSKALMRRCRKDQKDLRTEARALGGRLFAEKPKTFVARIETYWRNALAQSSKAKDKAQAKLGTKPDNVVPFGPPKDTEWKIG